MPPHREAQHATLQDEPATEPEELSKGRQGEVQELPSPPDARRLETLVLPCYRPLHGWRSKTGGRITFQRNQGWSDLPVVVACGKCVGCRIQWAADWTLRCVHEASLYRTSAFVTLTYDKEHVPKDGSVNLDELQRFMKRVRKRLGKVRYFGSGEYGERNKRPHYHALLFGVDLTRDSVLVRRSKGKAPLFRSPTLDALWQHQGYASWGEVEYHSAAYVARYVMKKLDGATGQEEYTRYDPDTGECWEVKPPFVAMSKRPGIGSDWIQKYHEDVYPSDQVVSQGRPHRPPRFYDRRLTLKASGPGEEGRAFTEILEEVLVARACRPRNAHEDSPGRLAVRERCAVARLSNLRRELED